MIILWYIALAILLFFGAKACRNNTWNEDNMSLYQTKCYLGFCAVIVVFHHISQATCASWLNPKYIRHGLDIFLTAGYPMVGMFFFCSGFGLYKSAKSKPDFFRRFLPVRLIPILLPTLLTTLVYIFFMYWKKVPFDIDSPIGINAHNTWHPYIWFVPCIVWMYILFYIGFGLFKKEKISILVITIGLIGYIIFCICFGYGTWWFNTPHMFLIGILVARNEKSFFESCKNHYKLRLAGTIILCIILYILGDSAGGLYHMLFHHPYSMIYNYIGDLIACIFQILYTLAFMSLYYLISMKLKIGNKALDFLGRFTLELYVVHGIFIHMFGYYMLKDGIKPIYYIENVPLFVLVVLGLAIPVSYALSIIDKKVGKVLKPHVTKAQ